VSVPFPWTSRRQIISSAWFLDPPFGDSAEAPVCCFFSFLYFSSNKGVNFYFVSLKKLCVSRPFLPTPQDGPFFFPYPHPAEICFPAFFVLFVRTLVFAPFPSPPVSVSACFFFPSFHFFFTRVGSSFIFFTLKRSFLPFPPTLKVWSYLPPLNPSFFEDG